MTTKTDATTELRQLVDQFILTSRSQAIRIALGDAIVACYVAGQIPRSEYHELMAGIR